MIRRARFITSLSVTPLDDGTNWRLTKALKYEDRSGALHRVPPGFTTDFASFPNISRIGAGLMLAGFLLSYYCDYAFALVWLGFYFCLVADDFTRDERTDAPAVLHDNGYRRQHLGRNAWMMKFYWDSLFYEAMRVNGVGRVKAGTIWLMVVLFGWPAWIKDGNK